MRQVVRIADYGRHSADGNGNGLGRGDGGVTDGGPGNVMRRGERLVVVTVTSLSVVAAYNGQPERFSLGHFTRGHEAHRRIRPGDTLVVVTETRANGQTEVELPDCGCRAMMWKD
jgi:hypothetical protein